MNQLQREKTTHTSGCLISLMVSFGESKTLYVYLTYEHTSTCIWHFENIYVLVQLEFYQSQNELYLYL